MMRIMVAAGLMIAATTVGTRAEAAFVTGERLYADCTAPESDPAYYAKAAACTMYITGVHDMMELSQDLNEERRCVPGGITAGQVRDAVVAYMRDNPQHRSFDAAALVTIALQHNYRCIIPTTRTRGGSRAQQ